MCALVGSWNTKVYFPYTLELRLKEGEIYGSVSFEYPEPKVRIIKDKGVIAIDTNVGPLHLAIAEVSPDGNLESYQSISLHEFIGNSKDMKDNEEWLLAHQIVNIATQKGKAMAIENLKKVKGGFREIKGQS